MRSVAVQPITLLLLVVALCAPVSGALCTPAPSSNGGSNSGGGDMARRRRASRSTARPEQGELDLALTSGLDERRALLATQLAERGVDVEELTMDRFFRGSAALRHYTSFVYPKTEAALHNAMRPQRASTVASQIAFLVREQRAAHAEWLVNHDRAVQESDQGSNGRPRTPLYLILDNLRSAANVGNILRAAEAARVEKVFCCGITPVPSPSEPKVLKTALGAAEYVPHEARGATLPLVRELQAAGVAVYACETTEGSLVHTEAELPSPLALCLGNEVIGVDTEVLGACDGTLRVPCLGVKNSLNVATCATIVMWEALRQWGVYDVDKCGEQQEGSSRLDRS